MSEQKVVCFKNIQNVRNGSEIAVLKFGFIICIILVIMNNVEKSVLLCTYYRKKGGGVNNLNCQGKLMNHKILMSHEILIVDWES